MTHKILLLIVIAHFISSKESFFVLDDNIKEYNIEVNEDSIFTVEIGTYSGTGYSWIIEDNSEYLTSLGIEKISNKDLTRPKAGKPILFQFKFKLNLNQNIIKPKEAKLVLGLKRPWESSSLRKCLINIKIN